MKKMMIIGAMAAAMLLGAQNVQAQSVVDGKTAQEVNDMQKELKKKEKIMKAADKAKANVTKAEKKVESARKAADKAAKKYEDAKKDLEKARKKAEEAEKDLQQIQGTLF